MRALSLAALNFLSWLAHRLSVEQVSGLGGVVGWWLGFGGRRTARAYENLAAAMPETSHAERREIVRRMWNNFGRTVAETLVLDRFAEDPTRITLTNPEVLEQCGKDGRGTIFTGMHFANWEVTTIPIVRRGIMPVSVYKPLKNEDVTAWLVRHREPIYPGGMYPASRSALWRMTKHVRSGGAICISGDHRDPAGVSVPFFGRPAPSGALPALLAVRYGARLFAIRVDRLPGARFTLTIEPIAVSDTGDMDRDVETTTASVQAKFEEWVRAEPGLWRWFYRRWDSRGKGPDRDDDGFRLGEIDGTITTETDDAVAQGRAAAE